MKQNFSTFSGIVGLVGGILPLVGPFFILGTAAATASSDATAGSILLLNALKIAKSSIRIIAIVYYKGDERVGVAPSELLIVGGSVAIIPFLGMDWWYHRIDWWFIIPSVLFKMKLIN